MSVFGIVYSYAFPVFLAYFCYNRGVESVSPARAVLFLGETLHPYHVAGFGLIGAGLWMAR